MPAEFLVFLIAMTPIGELRASIPFGLEAQLSTPIVYLVSVVGNMVPVLLIFTLLEKVVNLLNYLSSKFEKLITFVFEKTRRDHEEGVKKWGYLALVGFTAIPLPISGAWTASLVTYLFGLDYKKSFFAILLGVLLAGVIVLSILRAGDSLEAFSGLQVFGGLIIFGLLIRYFFKSKSN